MNNKLNKIFEILSFYDECRWSDAQNYNLINFYKDGLDDDTKLLTHLLCYITNRQMPFARIFDVGGFVFSELADCYKKYETNECFNLLNPKDKDSFILKKSDEKYSFIGKVFPDDLITNEYSDCIESNNRVIFTSRFMPIDYFSILYTLDILNCNEYKRSLSFFISKVYENHKDDKAHLIQKILFSLHLLSYYEIGQKNHSDIGNVNIEEVIKRSKEIKGILNNREKFNTEFKKFLTQKIFGQKRAWCCLRDFLKSPKFKSYFRESMKLHGLTEIEVNELSGIIMLHQLELPGDVWNNNPKFRNCIFKDTDFENDNKTSFNILLREYWENNPLPMEVYPEQFDITFDFAQRMCEKNNCDICPIGHLSDKGKEFEKICINDKDKFCPVALVGCGYKMMCKRQGECKLHKLLKFNTILSDKEKMMRAPIYKNNKSMTAEQKKIFNLLIKQGDNEFALMYFRKCAKENHTDEMKCRIENGLIEGYGMDEDD